MSRVNEQELFRRQQDVFSDVVRRGTAGVIVGGRSAPRTTRGLLWGLGSTGIGSVACDYQGEDIGPHTLFQVHTKMMSTLAPYTRYQPLDPDPNFLSSDLESLAMRYRPQRTTIIALINSPRAAFDYLAALPATLGPVVLVLAGPSGIYAESCPDVSRALNRLLPIRDFPDVPEGPMDLAMLAAGNVTYEIAMARRDRSLGNSHGMFAFYRDDQVDDPVHLDSEDRSEIHSAYEALAAPVTWPAAKFSGQQLTIVGASGIGGPLHVAAVSDGGTNTTTVDRDIIEGSNIARALLYGHDDVGADKATACPKRCDEIDTTGVHRGVWMDVQTGTDLDAYGSAKAVAATVDNDPAREMIDRAARSMGIAFATGATNPYGAYTIFRPPGTACFACQAGVASASRQLPSTPSCMETPEPSISATNMICSALLSRGLRTMLAETGRRPVNLRFRGRRNIGNRLVRKATPVTNCRH